MIPSSRTQEYPSLISAIRNISTVKPAAGQLQCLAENAARLVNADISLIYLHTNDHTQPVLKSMWGNSNELPQTRIAGANSIVSWVAAHRRSVVLNQPESRWDLEYEKSLNPTLHNVIAVPMISNKRAIGVIEACNSANEFSPADEEILLLLGAQMGVGLQDNNSVAIQDTLPEFISQLRTPLTSMNTIAYLLKQPELPEEQRYDLVNSFLLESNRINEAVNTYEELCNLETGRTMLDKHKTDIAALIQETIQQFEDLAAKQQVTFHIEIPGALPQCSFDPVRMKSVFDHIIRNAVQYNRTGGKVYVSAWIEFRLVMVVFSRYRYRYSR